MQARAHIGVIDRLLENNRRHAEERGPPPANGRPKLGLAVLACMDARLDPYEILGLGLGEAHVIRNAGGIASEDAIRSLTISQRLLGTDEVIVLQHTDCGMQTFEDEEFERRLEEDAGQRPSWKAGAFSDLDGSVRASVRTLRQSPFLDTDAVHGFVYDVETGLLREVNST